MGGLSHTVSGDIASFRTPSRVPIESLKFHFLPKQAAGTPTPENPIPIEGWTGLNGGRCHKNLIKPYHTKSTSTRGLLITPTTNGVRVTGTATAEYAIRLSSQDVHFLDLGKKYTFSLYINGDISGCKDPYLGYHTGETYRSIQNLDQSNNYKFTWTVPDVYANAPAPWLDMYIRVKEGSTVDFEIGLQMEAGENVTDYEPYSEELIPITFPTGKNLLNTMDVNNLVWSNTVSPGRIDSVNVGTGNSNYTKFNQVFHAGTYTISGKFSGPGVKAIRLLCSSQIQGSIWNSYYDAYFIDTLVGGKWTFTVNEDFTIGVVFVIADGGGSKPGSIYDLQLEYGSEATDFEPWSPISAFYGGYYDPVVGEIVATFKKINLKNKAWYYYTSNQFALTTDKKLLSEKVFCDMLPVSKINGYPTDDKSIGFWGNGQSYANIIFIKYEASNDVNDFKTWLNSLESDPCLIYEFDTPIHIPIPAQDLKAFLDHNNFWSDANDITEVTYPITESKDILTTRKKVMAFDHAHHKKVKWNQLAPAISSPAWCAHSSDISTDQFDNGVATLTTIGETDQQYRHALVTRHSSNFWIIGHKYYLRQDVLLDQNGYCICVFGNEWGAQRYVSKNVWTTITDTHVTNSTSRNIFGLYPYGSLPIGTVRKVKNIMLFDLTQMFGEGNEPSASKFEHICEINGIDLTTYQPYDEGSDRWLIVP